MILKGFVGTEHLEYLSFFFCIALSTNVQSAQLLFHYTALTWQPVKKTWSERAKDVF